MAHKMGSRKINATLDNALEDPSKHAAELKQPAETETGTEEIGKRVNFKTLADATKLRI